MSAYEPLRLPERPPMQHPLYLDAVRQAADELRAAGPWLLVQYPGEGGWLVARRRTWAMRIVTAVVNVWRRPRRWWLGRLRQAYFAGAKGRAGKALID